MRNRLLLVAERDVSGRVVAVWQRTKSDRVARPMTLNTLLEDDLEGRRVLRRLTT